MWSALVSYRPHLPHVLVVNQLVQSRDELGSEVSTMSQCRFLHITRLGPDVVASTRSPTPQEKPSTTYPKHLPIKTSHPQCASPGIDPMIIPHLRINCVDSTGDSCPGRISELVLTPSRTRFSSPLTITRAQGPWGDPPGM